MSIFESVLTSPVKEIKNINDFQKLNDLRKQKIYNETNPSNIVKEIKKEYKDLYDIQIINVLDYINDNEDSISRGETSNRKKLQELYNVLINNYGFMYNDKIDKKDENAIKIRDFIKKYSMDRVYADDSRFGNVRLDLLSGPTNLYKRIEPRDDKNILMIKEIVQVLNHALYPLLPWGKWSDVFQTAGIKYRGRGSELEETGNVYRMKEGFDDTKSSIGKLFNKKKTGKDPSAAAPAPAAAATAPAAAPADVAEIEPFIDDAIDEATRDKIKRAADSIE